MSLTDEIKENSYDGVNFNGPGGLLPGRNLTYKQAAALYIRENYGGDKITPERTERVGYAMEINMEKPISTKFNKVKENASDAKINSDINGKVLREIKDEYERIN